MKAAAKGSNEDQRALFKRYHGYAVEETGEE
jgi:hypothetical protein